MNKRRAGREAEQLAANFLESKGLSIIDQNYFFERSEIDIVALDGSIIAFIEVKMRRSLAFGAPIESIDERKIQSIQKAAEAWIYERKMDGHPVRFDVVSIFHKNNEEPEIEHLIDAFR